MKFVFFDEVAEFTLKMFDYMKDKVISGGIRGGKSDWIREKFMVDGPRQEAERETNPRQSVNQDSGTLAHGVVGSGNFYMNSVRRELEQRRSRLQMEIDMVNTALSLCTEEAEKTIQLQQILSRLDKKTY